MCTSQIYKVIDLQRSDKNNSSRSASFIYSNTKNDINDLYPFPRYLPIPIPCGGCIECRMQKASEWAFRCMKEAKEYENNVMITLTYDDEHLPKSNKIDSETGEVSLGYTLEHRDVQLFMKRLRKHYGNNVRFYGCGEYGSDKEYIDYKGQVRKATERPHYHIIMFNLKVDDLEFWKMSKCEWSKIQNPLFKSKTISNLWKNGHADLNEVNYETCKYVAGYVMKKWKGRDSDEHYMLKGQKPPYTFMSLKPGIGHAFFEKNKEKFLNEETFWQRTKKGLLALPNIRYFDKLIERDNPEHFEDIKAKRLDKAYQCWQDLMQKTEIERHEYIDNKIAKIAFKQRFAKKRDTF